MPAPILMPAPIIMPAPQHRRHGLPDRRTLERDFHSIIATNSDLGVRCRPHYPSDIRCSSAITYTTQTWQHAVQQLLTIRRLFEAGLDTKDLYFEAFDLSFQLFVWVFCTCPMHQSRYTGEDWTRLYRGVTAASGHGLRNEDLHEATFRAVGWEATPDPCENGDRD